MYYYDAAGQLIGFVVNGSTYYYVRNVQGDIIKILDGNMEEVVEYKYDTWGNVIGMEGSDYGKWVGSLNPFRYRGYYYDDETGMYYLITRYYNPEWGRFLNADNQVIVGNDLNGINVFAYCGNNPASRTDSTGEAWWHWLLGAAVVAACAVATVATAGGFAAGMLAVAAVGTGVAAATTASTIAAGTLIGSAVVYGTAVVSAAVTSSSVKEFNEKGNWGTVASTAGGAVLGGIGGYAMSKGSASPRSNNRGSTTSQAAAKPKIVSKINNDVIDLPRIGSALKTDPHHAFSNIVDNYAGYATKSPVSNGTLYQIKGSLNGTAGRFEWIIQDEKVVHRMFVVGGGINGIPIMP